MHSEADSLPSYEFPSPQRPCVHCRPGRRRTGCAPFFDQARMPDRKIPATWMPRRLLCRGRRFLLPIFSFAPAKKS